MPDTPTHAWQVLYPPLQSHARGWLDVGDGHEMYWEESGNPLGPAALFVHGGPGAGCTAADRRWFDPQRWRIVLFDQRGAGRSRPSGSLRANDMAHLLSDMEALRHHLGIRRWLLMGGSWGATLALAYAQQQPRQVLALVLRGIFTATASERRWLYGAQGAARRHPAAWQRLWAAAGAAPGNDVLDALHDRLQDTAAGNATAAARAWWSWEQDLMAAETTDAAPLHPHPHPYSYPQQHSHPHPHQHPQQHSHPHPHADAHCNAAEMLAHARIGVHYARHGFFLDEGQLLTHAAALNDVPGVIVQGTRDLVTPPAAARALHRAWPTARWCEVTTAGHASSHPAMARQLVAAIDDFADSLQTTPETHDDRHRAA